MTENKEETYQGREEEDIQISGQNAGVAIEWYVSSVDPQFSGPILSISAQGKTVEYPISEELYDDIKEDFNDLSYDE